MKRRPLITVFCATLAVALVGCAQADEIQAGERDTSAKVTLDYENVRIIYPISKYTLSSEDAAIISRAREAVMAECLQSQGVTIAPYEPLVEEDRDFGYWSIERASKYGFSLPGAG